MVQASQLEWDSQLGLPLDVTLKTVPPGPRCAVSRAPFSVAPPQKAAHGEV